MTRILWNEQEFELKNLKLENDILSGTVNGETISLPVVTDKTGRIISAANSDGLPMPVLAATKREYTFVQWKGKVEKITFSRGREGNAGETEGDGSVTAPMPGKILELMAKAGDIVEKDQVLVLMESMKLQVEIQSPIDGVVGDCPVSVGDMVDGDSLLMQVDAAKQQQQ